MEFEGPLLCSQDPTTAPDYESNESRPYCYTPKHCNNKFTLQSWGGGGGGGEGKGKKEKKKKKTKYKKKKKKKNKHIK